MARTFGDGTPGEEQTCAHPEQRKIMQQKCWLCDEVSGAEGVPTSVIWGTFHGRGLRGSTIVLIGKDEKKDIPNRESGEADRKLEVGRQLEANCN